MSLNGDNWSPKTIDSLPSGIPRLLNRGERASLRNDQARTELTLNKSPAVNEPLRAWVTEQPVSQAATPYRQEDFQNCELRRHRAAGNKSMVRENQRAVLIKRDIRWRVVRENRTANGFSQPRHLTSTARQN